ncbi:hypothetical protein P4133_00070 [Pseudomonas aeruginosa]|nr:hypothetical protein [Pseudomonas aeruginosa]
MHRGAGGRAPRQLAGAPRARSAQGLRRTADDPGGRRAVRLSPAKTPGNCCPGAATWPAGLDLAASHGDAGQINRSAAAFSDYLQRQARGWSDGSSRPPPGAAPSILDGAAMLEAGLGLEGLVAAYAMVFMAAFETTISMVGNATLALLTHPDQLDLLRRCPELVANAVEELLRFDGAVRGGVRYTLEEVEIGGQRIPPGRRSG